MQTADMLNLPVPKANYQIVKVVATETQKKTVESFAERAEKIHNKTVSSDVDNMLMVTSDGRKAARDQRLITPILPDEEGSKINVCVRNVFDTWEQNKDKPLTQMVFCDLSTPKGDGKFNVYDDIREKLVNIGIPREEIAFIHTADTDAKKKELFAKVRADRFESLWVRPSKWAPAPMCKGCSNDCTTLTILSDRAILSREPGVLSDKVIRTMRWIFPDILPRALSMRICISLWSQNRSLSHRS